MLKLGFGLMRLPTLENNRENIDIELFKKMVDEFIKAGGTYFDTAWPYHSGMSELAFKEAVTMRYPRASYTLTDKMPMYAVNTKEDLQATFEKQLEKTGVSYFDYYWLHALGDHNYGKVQELDAFGFISEMKKQGKIIHIGFSCHCSPELLDKILTEHPEAEYVQLQINYADWEDEEVQSRRCYEVATKHKKPVIVMEPVKGGTLARLPAPAEKILKDYHPNLSPASWAIRYTCSLENVMVTLSGMSNLEQVQDNLSYMKDFKPLTEEEQKVLQDAKKALNEYKTIPCTACRYCISEQECPMGIKIPDLFSVYNGMKGLCYQWGPARDQYNEITKDTGLASACVECGGCEAHCPQHLPIREHLKTIAKEYERK